MHYRVVDSREVTNLSTNTTFGIRISVLLERDLSESEQKLCRDFIYDLTDAVDDTNALNNVVLRKEGEARAQVLERLFEQPIYAERVKNSYEGDRVAGQIASPWLRVTTSVGHFVVGWRKRVINIDYSGINVKGLAAVQDADPFSAIDVTKTSTSIHAWGLENARNYIATIIDIAKRAK